MQAQQKRIEQTFSRKGLVALAIEDLRSNPEIAQSLDTGTTELTNWMNQDYWESKNQRISNLAGLEIPQLTDQICALIALECTKPMKLVSIASMAAKFLNMSDKLQSIHLMAEVIAVLRATGLYSITKPGDSYEVQALVALEADVMANKTERCFVPPMTIRPKYLRSNRDSGYLTGHGESLILGFYENHHEGDICLDVLNTLNQTQLSLDTDFLSSVEEVYTKPEYTPEEWAELTPEEREIASMERSNWEQFKAESDLVIRLMQHHGNKFYLTHKVDKRGRIYSRGYHINSQGSSYRKAMLNLTRKEICEGIEGWSELAKTA